MSSPARIVRFAAAVACALAFAACAEETSRSAGVKSDAKPAPSPAAVKAPAPSAGTKAPGPTADPNKALVERVRLALARDTDIPDDIDVSADGGVVSLWGRINNEKEGERAVEIARAVVGVQRVENKLVVAKGP